MWTSGLTRSMFRLLRTRLLTARGCNPLMVFADGHDGSISPCIFYLGVGASTSFLVALGPALSHACRPLHALRTT